MTSVLAQRRQLLVGAVGLIKRFRLKDGGRIILEVRNELEDELTSHEYLKHAPFRTVSLIFHYGTKDDLEPSPYSIEARTESLNVAVEFDAARLRTLSPSQLKAEFRTAMIEVLCDVAANYDLPYQFLDELRKA
jgi:hypothetical protein